MNEQKDFLNVKPLDIEKFIKVNELQEVTNPIFFSQDNSPTPDGLLSNEIFGITMADRANTFAYITLGGKSFIHPLFYAIWKRVDTNIASCVHSTQYFKISPEGYLEKSTEEDGGETGIPFLQRNIDKIHFKKSESTDRMMNISFLEKFKSIMFIKHYIIIPAFYRDVNTERRNTGVGDINKLYQRIMLASNSLREMDEFGITTYDAVMGRIQDLLLEIYIYFTKGSKDGGAGIAGKFGVIRNAVQSKTSDYSARLIMTAPNLKVENIEDLPVDIDHAYVPLAACVSIFYPFVLAYVRNYFNDEYNTNSVREVHSKKDLSKVVAKVKLKDVRIAFSDDILKDEIDRFIHGASNRLRPIVMPTEDPKYPYIKLRFIGRHVSSEEATNRITKTDEQRMNIVDRDMTWADLLFQAAVEVTEDKTALITRYPIDTIYNQFPTLINVASTIHTEPLIVNNKFYKYYPKIRQELIGTNTTNLFKDALNICNAILPSIGGDYDGDQVTIKGVYSVEANAELRAEIKSKRHIIALGGKSIFEGSNEYASSIHALTSEPTEYPKGYKDEDPVF